MQGGTTPFARVGGPSRCVVSSHPRRSRSRLSRRFPRRGRQHRRDRLRRPDVRVRGPPGEQQVARRLGDARDDRRAGGHRRSRRRLDRRSAGRPRARRGGRVDPDRPRGVPVATTRAQMYYEVTAAGACPEVRRSSPRTSQRAARTSFAVLEMGRPEVVVARLGRRAAGQPADLPSRQPRHVVPAGGRPRTGTAAPAPATPTPTASGRLAGADATAASGARSS